MSQNNSSSANGIEIPLTVRHSDHSLEQVWRDSTHAVYKHFGAYGQFIGWEAIKIKRKRERVVFGTFCPAKECYPATSDFGKLAFSVGAQYDLEDAIKRAKKI